MAKTRAKSDDSPTITVRLEKGRLAPVSAYDQELLAQWHEGAELNVDVTRVKVRPLEKRYRAMLGQLIKTADTPWSNALTAHEALKLATGFITPSKRKSGLWKPLSRHISSFTDAELSEFYELFCGIVQERFGITPEELAREAPDTESSGSPSNSVANGGPGADPIPVGAGVLEIRDTISRHPCRWRARGRRHSRGHPSRGAVCPRSTTPPRRTGLAEAGCPDAGGRNRAGRGRRHS